MLMYAEIVGPTDKAKSSVDDICERAGVPTVPDHVTPEEFAEIVDWQRRLELASEGIRWHDLVRQNRYVEVL